ncbi:alpha/beta hydrolase [Brevibacterium gallinarum]|uniref:Alpha/beta hydrolase n=1 Tax=Brevibacterium gallinarum TaxID=2762220 RepID=A0ABR8WTQ9_9MICO|nr:alpha/beta hydrolase [Brevibacterium gallinarum]MBD8020453.1 alpha/beta hydrolase [Brevibacterium gallinarum]
MAAQRQWHEDILGSRFRMLPISVGEDETAVIIAPVRVDEEAGTNGAPDRAAEPALTPTGHPEPVVPADTAVIYLHGWSDYFFHHRLADYYASLGIAFYAIDLRRYGRSLLIDAAGGPEHWAPDTSGADAALPDEAAAQALAVAAKDGVEDDLPGRVLTGHETRAGFIDDLTDYDEEIAQAFDIVREENPGARVLLHGHSTGGLILSLWAARHPGEAAALLLNSPWLEFQYDAAARKLMNAWMSLRSMSAKPLNVRMPNFYTLASASLGRLPYDLRLKPPGGFPIYPAWLQAIFAGHEQVAAGLDLTIPALVQTSAATLRGASFSPSMATADIILDVDVIARRALSLGRSVTIEKIPDAMHDVFMSAETPRRQAYDGLARFLYGALD